MCGCVENRERVCLIKSQRKIIFMKIGGKVARNDVFNADMTKDTCVNIEHYNLCSAHWFEPGRNGTYVR